MKRLIWPVLLALLLTGCSSEFLKKVVPGLDPENHPVEGRR